MANNEEETTAETLKRLLAKSDALDQKLTNMDNNNEGEFNKTKVNLENFKALQKEEVTNIKKTVENIEESQDIINRKFENHWTYWKERLTLLKKDYKKLFAENADVIKNMFLWKKNLQNLNKK